PVLGVLFWHMLYAWWIPLYAAYRRGRTGEMRLLLAPTLIQILFLIVSPVMYSRYALGLLFTSPLLLFITLRSPSKS
ncbi:MAG: hypothetical protein IK096_02265, partial [Lachnospiraceae bacterium]|nr:hypothetical protein [Lachnospiraceae bacterium]